MRGGEITENLVRVKSLQELWRLIEDFRARVKADGKVEWNYWKAFEIMRVDPAWFVDERSIELLETYLFYRPNPSQAFSGPISDQPAIWIETKILLDGIIESDFSTWN